MNHCNFQQNVFVPHEESRAFVSIFEQKDHIVCPKPRRIGVLANNATGPLRVHTSQTAEICDTKAGAELLDIILRKEDYVTDQSLTSVASPPFFFGSPPSRATNPLVQDANFRDNKVATTSPFPFLSSPSGLSSPSSASRKASCGRMKFSLKQAAIRVEGFDCLNRDRNNSRIPAMA